MAAATEALIKIGTGGLQMAGDVYNSYVSSPPQVAVLPGSKPGTSSSAAATAAAATSVIYEPQPSDLAYLLHDPDEEIYSDSSTPPTTPIPVKYIVENLADYGAKCIPLKVYVSALLRTWETALLLYLPFLFNATQSDYSQTLILEISPFLLEEDDIEVYKQNSNKPLDFRGNVQEFFKFIKLFIYFIYLNNQNKDNIMGIPESYLKEIPNNFTIILIAGTQKVCLRIDVKEGKVEYAAPNIQLDTNPITIPDKTLQKIRDNIIIGITPPNIDSKYVSYDDNRLGTKTPPPTPLRTIYSTFQLWGGSINFNDFETIAKFRPHIFSFLKWVIEFKSHPKNTPILFVSHSKTMVEFLKMMILNHHYNYTNTGSNFLPTQEFVNACTSARETNTWSMRFKYLGYNVTGFRHAQSCDNMYKALKMKVFPSSEREKFGNYTNLSLWGIFSTLIFIRSNKVIISDFAAAEINKSGLMVLSGMDKQSNENITKFGINNELTCGDLLTRFSPPTTKKRSGVETPDNSLTLKVEAITNLVNTIPPSIPLQEMYTTDRQRMSNELYSLCNIFKIEFRGCDGDGCKIKVTYIGPYNFEGIIKGRSYNDLSSEDKKTIDALAQRKVYITINKMGNDHVLTLQNVYKGGLAIGEDGTQTIRGKVAQTFLRDKTEKILFYLTNSATNFNNDRKVEISSDFQESVRFLMGFDLIDATLVTYDTAYNTNILYSNLLIRQLLDTYQLISSDKAVNWGPESLMLGKYSQTQTIAFLSKDTAQLYGGKKNKKSKHKQNKNK